MALLEVKSIQHSFGGLKAVDNVDFDVAQGRIKAVIGPNGAGKTTLFNIISGVISPDSGNITFNDRPISGLKPWQIAGHGISRTFQHLSLFPHMTVLENVMVGRHKLSRAGILASTLRLPSQLREERDIAAAALRELEFVGLADLAEVAVSDLSFGKRRMVELARALATEAELVLLDEPASGLNTGETAELAKLIMRIRDRGVTVLLVEHDMSLVMDISDEILVLNFGKPIAEGDPATVRNNPDVISVYLGGAFSDVAD